MGERTEKIKRLIEKEKDSMDVIAGMLDLFEEMEEEVEELNKKYNDLEDELDAMNEDISMLNDGMHVEEYDDSVFSAVCPYCQEEIEIDLEKLDDDEDFKCPKCGKEITLEWDDECDCGCCGDHEHDCVCDDCDCYYDDE